MKATTNIYFEVVFEINDIKVLTGSFEKINVHMQELGNDDLESKEIPIKTTFDGDKGSFGSFDSKELKLAKTDQPFELELGREYVLHYNIFSSWNMFSNNGTEITNETQPTDEEPILNSFKGCKSEVIKSYLY